MQKNDIPKGREITIYIYTFNEKLNEEPEEIEYEDEKGNKKITKINFTKKDERILFFIIIY